MIKKVICTLIRTTLFLWHSFTHYFESCLPHWRSWLIRSLRSRSTDDIPWSAHLTHETNYWFSALQVSKNVNRIPSCSSVYMFIVSGCLPNKLISTEPPWRQQLPCLTYKHMQLSATSRQHDNLWSPGNFRPFLGRVHFCGVEVQICHYIDVDFELCVYILYFQYKSNF